MLSKQPSFRNWCVDQHIVLLKLDCLNVSSYLHYMDSISKTNFAQVIPLFKRYQLRCVPFLCESLDDAGTLNCSKATQLRLVCGYYNWF